jgi:hypothetical protein
MSGESSPTTAETNPPLPRDGFSDSLLTVEIEPTADGGQRALSTRRQNGAALATRWPAVQTATLVDIDDVQ